MPAQRRDWAGLPEPWVLGSWHCTSGPWPFWTWWAQVWACGPRRSTSSTARGSWATWSRGSWATWSRGSWATWPWYIWGQIDNTNQLLLLYPLGKCLIQWGSIFSTLMDLTTSAQILLKWFSCNTARTYFRTSLPPVTICLYKDLNTNVHSDFICNCQKLESTQCPSIDQ